MEVEITISAQPAEPSRPVPRSVTQLTGTLEDVLIDFDRWLYDWGWNASRRLGLVGDSIPEFLPCEVPFWLYVIATNDGAARLSVEVDGSIIRAGCPDETACNAEEASMFASEETSLGMLGFLVDLDEALARPQSLEPFVGGPSTDGPIRSIGRVGNPIPFATRAFLESVLDVPATLDEMTLLAAVRRRGRVRVESAARLGCSPETAERLVERGLLKETGHGEVCLQAGLGPHEPSESQYLTALVRHARRRGWVDFDETAALLDLPAPRASSLLGAAVDQGDLMPWGRRDRRGQPSNPLFVPLADGLYPFAGPPPGRGTPPGLRPV